MIWLSAEEALMSTSAERVRPERDARDQEDRDVGNPDLLRDERGQRADRKDQPAGEQRVLGDGDRA